MMVGVQRYGTHIRTGRNRLPAVLPALDRDGRNQPAVDTPDNTEDNEPPVQRNSVLKKWFFKVSYQVKCNFVAWKNKK